MKKTIIYINVNMILNKLKNENIFYRMLDLN